MNPVTVRMSTSSNGVPVFQVSSTLSEFSRVFGATFNRDSFSWMYPAYFPVSDIVLEDFKALSIPITFSDSVYKYLAALEDVRKRHSAKTLPKDFPFITKPFDHQIEGLAHVYYMMRAALFFSPGLGKSKIAVDLLRLLKHTGKFKPCLLLGPLVTIRNWGKEIDRHSGSSLKWRAVLGLPKKKEEAILSAKEDSVDVLLVTYDTASRYEEKLLEKYDYGIVIADESHQIKTWNSARTKAAFELSQKASRRVIMTGTPTLGSPDDLYGQFKFLGDYFMPESYGKYRDTFFEMSLHNKYAVIGYKNLQILNRRTCRLSIKKTKEECLTLPPQILQDIFFDLTRDESALYNQLILEMGLNVSALKAFLDPTNKEQPAQQYDIPSVAVLLNKLSQVRSGFLLTSNVNPQICDGCPHMASCVKAKIEPYTKKCLVVQKEPDPTLTRIKGGSALSALEELLDTILADPTSKTIIWAKYSYEGTELDSIEEILNKKQISFVRVDGKTGAGIQSKVDRFNDDTSIRVYLGQIATGVGITLNSASYMIYFSVDYSLGTYLQSLDRNHRIGQTKSVTVYRLIGSGTLDGSILKLLDEKVEVNHVLTTRLAVIPSNMKRDTIKARSIRDEETFMETELE